MAVLDPEERNWLTTISQLCYCNPFLPERIACERAALGADFVEAEATWNLRGDDLALPLQHPGRLSVRLEPLLQQARTRLAQGEGASVPELLHYEDAVFLLLYYRYQHELYHVITQTMEHPTERHACRFYRAFLRDWEYYFAVPGYAGARQHEAAHIFACFFRCAALSSTFFAISLVVPWPPPACGRWSGSRSLPMICAAIAVLCTRIWEILPRSLPAHPAPARSWWRRPLAYRVIFPSMWPP